VAIEAAALLRGLTKSRYEENLEIIAKLEGRLVFEIQNIRDSSFTSSLDGEDFPSE